MVWKVGLVRRGATWYFSIVKAVRFGPHADKKFDDLGRYNMFVTRERAGATVRHPDRPEMGQKGQMVATARHPTRMRSSHSIQA
ncbi:MAG: hypothetical protein U0587_20085 [Candidatus Binatia bacterium]